MAEVLVIDDDFMICEMIEDIITDLGHRCRTARSLKQGLALAEAGNYDVIFQDVYLADGVGLDVLSRLKQAPGKPEVIVITGAGDPDVAERAMRLGVWDFVAKPLDLQSVIAPFERAVEYRRQGGGASRRGHVDRQGIAGSSPLMRALLDTVVLAGESGASVLVTGETGTGKELAARAIHQNSPRRREPFVVVDCASLPETLVESTLFGHVKGAFTGADQAREGLVKQADGGTLFLDEIGELPFPMQRSFLRVLEERTFRPVGAKTEQTSDFRLVAATNRDLDALVRQGDFRKDLLYRIRSFSIELPPLRERVDDIQDILELHMSRLESAGRFMSKDFSPEFMLALKGYSWPGNVRELVQCLERALAAAHADKTLYLKHLPDEVRISYAKTLVRKEDGASAEPVPNRSESNGTLPPEAFRASHVHSPPSLDVASGMPTWSGYREEVVSQAEREYFERLMQATGGGIKQSCSVAGVSRARLYQILQKHDIKRPR